MMKRNRSRDVIAAVRATLGGREISSSSPVSLHEPLFGAAEIDAVAECVRSGWVSTSGTAVESFEQKLSEITRASHAISCVNGTSALHISLMLAGVEPGDEVIVPALTFVATAAAVKYCGAIPHFVDVACDDFGIDPAKLAIRLDTIAERKGKGMVNRVTGRRIAAILPVHCFGYICRIDDIVELAGRFAIPVVEDAAEALGSVQGGRAAGTFGLLGALSFNGNKIITTGGGGAVITSDAALATRARHLTTTAKLPHRWAYTHDMLGYNYRLPSLNAALGNAQLARFEMILDRKRKLHDARRFAHRRARRHLTKSLAEYDRRRRITGGP
jgi:perosamine synthetase